MKHDLHLCSRFLIMKKILLLTLLLFSTTVFALKYTLVSNDNTVIGAVQHTQATFGETITDLGQIYQIGYLEFKEANPDVNPNHLWVGKNITIPSQFILPQTDHAGIVINQAELRLYYYPPHQNIVYTYPIGIGRPETTTPVTLTKIIDKDKAPTWYPTPATIIEASEHGLDLPSAVPPGPDNPLGDYAMRMGMLSPGLNKPSYLIHGTNDPTRVGIRSTGGCISLYPDNIAELFPMVSIGTPVNIINDPVKAGWGGDLLYLEAHVPLSNKNREDTQIQYMRLAGESIKQAFQHQRAEINWEKVSEILQEQHGIPEVIGHKV